MLPKLPYKMQKNKQQVVAMRGINLSNATADGDVADSKGIGAQAYPYITTRKGRMRLEDEISDVIDFTYFGGKKVEVRAEEGGAGLYYDGFRVCDVTLGEKQFAKINTKLVIFPDKIYLDETGRCYPLGAKKMAYEAKFTTSSVELGSAVAESASGYGGKFSGNVFTISEKKPTTLFAGEAYRKVTNAYYDSGDLIQKISFFTYLGTDITNAGISITTEHDEWTGQKTWAFTVTIPLKGVKRMPKVGDLIYINNTLGTVPNGISLHLDGVKKIDEVNGTEENGSITVKYGTFEDPYKNGGSKAHRINVCLIDGIDYGEYFSAGEYVAMTTASGEIDTFLVEAVGQESYGAPYYEGCGGVFYVRIKANEKPLESGRDSLLMTLGWPEYPFPAMYSVGAKIIFSGTCKREDLQHQRTDILNNNFTAEITDVTENSITVDREFVEEDLKEANISIFSYTDTGLGEFKAGDAVTISGSTVAENNTTFIIDKIDGSTFYSASEIFTPSEQDVVLTIEREIPKLDFICESNNRLWGCSNKDSTIYSSALGDPTNIYAYKDLSTDSYAVAVASSGDFTACCRHGDAVLFWKQDKLYKLLGSYPSEYALYDYDIDGVQAGAHESIAIINEALYYKAVHGVYVYRGGTPQLISSNFGDRRFEGGTGGGYGNRYYFSTSDGERDYLFVYDTLLGMWVLEDDIRVRTFFRKDGDELYMLTEGGEVYLCDAGESETGIEWFVQLTPFYETIDGRKSYSRIKLRVEVPQGSYMSVSIRCDGGRWHECGKIVGKNAGVIPVAIPINRCDKFEIKLSGKGKCTILSMMREFYLKEDK